MMKEVLLVYRERGRWFADSVEFGIIALPYYVRSAHDVIDWKRGSYFYKEKRLLIITEDRFNGRKRYWILNDDRKCVDYAHDLSQARRKVIQLEGRDRAKGIYVIGAYTIYDALKFEGVYSKP